MAAALPRNVRRLVGLLTCTLNWHARLCCELTKLVHPGFAFLLASQLCGSSAQRAGGIGGRGDVRHARGHQDQIPGQLGLRGGSGVAGAAVLYGG